jgi:hypothetical protein
MRKEIERRMKSKMNEVWCNSRERTGKIIIGEQRKMMFGNRWTSMILINRCRRTRPGRK